MDLIMPKEYRLEARLTNAMTLLAGVNACIPHHVKACDYDLIEKLVDVTIRDSLDGQVTRFFQQFYRDNTPSEFLLLTVDQSGREVSRRQFTECHVVKHCVKTTDQFHALLAHHIVMRYEDLLVN
jgi:hypothetical protein